MKQFKFNLICLVFVLATIPMIVNAQAPQLINYQGSLQENGTPVTGAKNITFSIFNVETGGANIWTETQSAVTVTNGVFQVLLGSVTSFPVTLFNSDGARYLEVTVDGTILSPRNQFTSVSYALSAKMAEEVKAGEVVTSLNNLEDDVTLAAGANIGITAAGNTLTISSSISDNSISAVKISDEPGLTYTSLTNTINLTNTATHIDLATVTITIPEPGFIYLSGRVMVELNGTTSGNGIRMQIDTTEGGSDQSGVFSYVYLNQFASTGIHYFDCTAQRTYIVNTPGEYTFRLEARKQGGAGTANLLWPKLTAQYFPTSYGVITETSSNIFIDPDSIKPTK